MERYFPVNNYFVSNIPILKLEKIPENSFKEDGAVIKYATKKSPEMSFGALIFYD